MDRRLLRLCQRRPQALLPPWQEALGGHTSPEEDVNADAYLGDRLLLGYVAGQNRLYLMDKAMTMINQELLYSVLQYQQAIVEKNFEGAEKLLSTVPKDSHLKLAKFLETNDYKELAYNITPDPTHK